jgi:hypothetical protein
MASRNLPLGHKARGEAAAAAAADARDPRTANARRRYNASHRDSRAERVPERTQRGPTRSPALGSFAPQWSLDQRGSF